MTDIERDLLEMGFEQSLLYKKVDAACDLLALHFKLQGIQETSGLSFESAALLGQLAETTKSASGEMFSALFLSNEELLEKQQGFFAKLFGGVKQTFQKNLDYFHLSMKSAGEIKRRLKDCREMVAFKKREMDNPKEVISIHVPNSRYIHAGKQKVSSGPEYLTRFEDLADSLVKFSEAIEKLLHKNSYLPEALFAAMRDGETTEWMADNYKLLQSTVNDIRRIKKLNPEERTSKYTIEATDGLLGDAQIVVSSYSGSVDLSKPKEIVEGAHYTYAYLFRSDKFKVTDALPHGSTEMEFTIADLEKLLNYCEFMLTRVEKMLSHEVQKTMNIVNLMDGAFWFNSYRDHTKGKGDFGASLDSTKLSNRFAAILFDAVSSIYNFGSGNIEKALSIVEKAAK